MARKTGKKRTLLERVADGARDRALVPDLPVGIEKEPIDRRRVWSIVETQTQIQRIEQLILGALSPNAIIRVMMEQFSLPRRRVENLIGRVRLRWLSEDVEARPTNRAEQVRRVKGYLQLARGERAPQTAEERALNIPGKWITKPDLRALEKFESLLADLQGTRAPLQVEVNANIVVQQSLQAVISNMSQEQMAERIAVARERREKARILELGPGPVTQ